jgi:hypothetical protein
MDIVGGGLRTPTADRLGTVTVEMPETVQPAVVAPVVVNPVVPYYPPKQARN